MNKRRIREVLSGFVEAAEKAGALTLFTAGHPGASHLSIQVAREQGWTVEIIDPGVQRGRVASSQQWCAVFESLSDIDVVVAFPGMSPGLDEVLDVFAECDTQIWAVTDEEIQIFHRDLM